MKYAIDETELARLWALACAAGDADYSAHDDADDSTKYAAAACNNVPALVAEVRRLREALNKEHRAWQCADARGDWLEMENAALREKDEAWRDAAEFEATVASKLTWLDAEDLPCANSMGIFCPRAPFRGRNCGPWCLLRMARLDAEEEMKKNADCE